MTLRLTEAEFSAMMARRPVSRAAPPEAEAPNVAMIDGRLTATMPIRLINGANERAGWWTRSKRAKAHRNAVRLALQHYRLPALPAVITITRAGPKKLDSDNLAISCKHVRDALAELYGTDDGSDLYVWAYSQVTARAYACRVEIAPFHTP